MSSRRVQTRRDARVDETTMRYMHVVRAAHAQAIAVLDRCGGGGVQASDAGT